LALVLLSQMPNIKVILVSLFSGEGEKEDEFSPSFFFVWPRQSVCGVSSDCTPDGAAHSSSKMAQKKFFFFLFLCLFVSFSCCLNKSKQNEGALFSAAWFCLVSGIIASHNALNSAPFWWYYALPAVFCSLTNVLMNLVSQVSKQKKQTKTREKKKFFCFIEEMFWFSFDVFSLLLHDIKQTTNSRKNFFRSCLKKCFGFILMSFLCCCMTSNKQKISFVFVLDLICLILWI
jgi:hypothetical protein